MGNLRGLRRRAKAKRKGNDEPRRWPVPERAREQIEKAKADYHVAIAAARQRLGDRVNDIAEISRPSDADPRSIIDQEVEWYRLPEELQAEMEAAQSPREVVDSPAKLEAARRQLSEGKAAKEGSTPESGPATLPTGD